MVLARLDIHRCPSCIGGKSTTTEETGIPSMGICFFVFSVALSREAVVKGRPGKAIDQSLTTEGLHETAFKASQGSVAAEFSCQAQIVCNGGVSRYSDDGIGAGRAGCQYPSGTRSSRAGYGEVRAHLEVAKTNGTEPVPAGPVHAG